MIELSRHEIAFSLAANEKKPLQIGGDYLYFHTVPSGVSASINNGSASAFVQGELHQGTPGAREIERVFFENTTGGALDVRVVFGMGRMTVAGVATLVGSIPLPAGASTAARQDTGNASLAAILAAVATAARQDTGNTALASILAAIATAAKQDAQTALLTTLAGVTTETPDTVIVAASTNVNFANCRTLSVLNTGPTDITVTIGANVRTLAAGSPAWGWSVSGPFNKLATVNVAAPATGSAEVSTTV